MDNKPKTLHLPLNAEPFEVMETGKKDLEFRKPGNWILCRLQNKDGTRKKIDFIKFVNGYGNHRPYFICKYKGFWIAQHPMVYEYSNGLRVEVEVGDVVIRCGEVVERGNAVVGK